MVPYFKGLPHRVIFAIYPRNKDLDFGVQTSCINNLNKVDLIFFFFYLIYGLKWLMIN